MRRASWHASRRRREWRRRWATRAARARGIARRSSGSRTAPSAPCARCTPGAATRGPPGPPGLARARPSSPPGSTGTSGSARGPTRPYNGTLAPFVWRWVWDFGNGTMPDMAPHHFDPAFNALGLDAPVTMEARASYVDPKVTMGSNLVTYQYAASGDRGPLTLFWYDNGLRPPTPLGIDPDDPRQRLGEGDNGLLLVGEKGILTCAGWSGMPRLLPDGTAPRLQAAAEDPPPRRRASCRLAPGLQGRHTRVQQLRVRRATHRVHPPRHAGAPDGQGREVGRRGHDGHQRAGSAAVHRRKLPQGVGAANLSSYAGSALAIARGYCRVELPPMVVAEASTIG